MSNPATPPFVLSANTVTVDSESGNLAHWKATIEADRAASLPNIFTPQFSDMMRRVCDNAELEQQDVKGVGKRWIEPLDRVGKILSLVLSAEPIFDWVGAAGGRGPVNLVSGRLASYPAGEGEFLDWHDDNFEHRKIAIVIDLSEHEFDGGEFQLRTRKDRKVIFKHQVQGFGTALIFQITNDIEHRLLPVTAGGPRRTFAGWFFQRR